MERKENITINIKIYSLFGGKMSRIREINNILSGINDLNHIIINRHEEKTICESKIKHTLDIRGFSLSSGKIDHRIIDFYDNLSEFDYLKPFIDCLESKIKQNIMVYSLFGGKMSRIIDFYDNLSEICESKIEHKRWCFLNCFKSHTE